MSTENILISILPTSIRNIIAWRQYFNYLQNQSTICNCRNKKINWLRQNDQIISIFNWSFLTSFCYVYYVTSLESQCKLTHTEHHDTYVTFDMLIGCPHDQYNPHIAVSLHASDNIFHLSVFIDQVSKCIKHHTSSRQVNNIRI